MLKRILLILFLLFSFFLFENNTLANSCGVNSTLENCLLTTDLVHPDGSLEIGSGGFKDEILGWIAKIGGFLGLMAIGGITWGSFMMVISIGEEDKIKKAKDIIKWSIMGFVGIILASSFIALLINFMYDIGN